MTTKKFGPTVPSVPGAFEDAALGVDGTSPNRFTDKEINKVVKLGTADNYVLAVATDEIEGIVASIEGHNVNNGFSFGTVQRKFGNVVAKQTGVTVVVVGDTLVADAQAALGTSQDYPNVKKGVPTKFLWRVKSLMGNAGAQNALLLMELIGGG